MANNFEYYSPTRVIFGKGTESETGKLVKEYGGSKVLLVYGGKSAILAHNDLTGCGNDGGDFMSHKLEHEIGGMFDVIHGAGLAAVWPSWARSVYKDALPRFVRYARNVMGVVMDGSDEEIALAGIAAMEAFYNSIGMPVNFSELGIDPTEEQIEEMADRCMTACGRHTGSAKRLSREDMTTIYRKANER